MNKSSLLKQCRLIYNTIEQQIDNGAQAFSNVQWIERSFTVSVLAWSRIETQVNNYEFTNQQEERYFYNTVKPRFIGLIDYITLLYKSVLFQPDTGTKAREYWKHELNNCREFISRYKTRCRYYQTQQPEANFYFFSENDNRPLVFGLNINRFNPGSISYSYLLGKMIAIKKYKKFIQREINKNVSK